MIQVYFECHQKANIASRMHAIKYPHRSYGKKVVAKNDEKNARIWDLLFSDIVIVLGIDIVNILCGK